MIQWPHALIQDIARRRGVLFLGAGVSKNSVGNNGKHPPDWEEFLWIAIKQCDNPKQHLQSLMKKNDYLTVCEIVKSRLGRGFVDLLRQEFVVPAYRSATIHDHLFKLDLRLVLTQNFDKIYDTYAQTQSNNTIVVKNYYDTDVASVIRERLRTILKVHGTIDSPNRMIFTRQEYSRARHQHADFYAVLDALALTHTFLFIGCGLSDPDMRILLERQAHLYGIVRPHYIIMPKTRNLHAEYRQSIENNMCLEVIRYDSSSNHSELTDSLEELVKKVEENRLELATTMDW